MRIVCLLVLSVLSSFAEEKIQKIDAKKAVALAERFVVEKGLMNAPVDGKRGDPEHLLYQGKIDLKAWGYQKIHEGTGYERWRILFPITVNPVPKVKGNETAWGMLVEMDPFGTNIHVSHGIAAGYDGKPFLGFSPIRNE